jgi:myo-inositol-1-phosphate synthase
MSTQSLTQPHTHKYIETQSLVEPDGSISINTKTYDIIVHPKKNPKLGVMLVGLGGSNGSTLVASLLAHKKRLTWNNKNGAHQVNFLGSISQYGSVHIGYDAKNTPHSKLFKDIGDMYNVDDLVIGGWDICGDNLYEACKKAKVLDYDLLRQLEQELTQIVPLPSVVRSNFISANQLPTANNLMKETDLDEIIPNIMEDIQNFKKQHNLDRVIVMWTASTERYSEKEWYDMDNLINCARFNDPEISPSMLFAMSTLFLSEIFLNGSPQNTICNAIVELARKNKTFVGGSDYRSGQTRLKAVLVDYLALSGVKPLSIVSYNHLGNNDGKNLSDEPQFRSKEITKKNVIDDVVLDNPQLFENGKKPDHCVVIKYVPSAGDTKKAMDEYSSQLMLDGRNTLAIYNVCEDTLLAVPVMLDLILFSEFFSRIMVSSTDDPDPKPFDTCLSYLSYFFKSPAVNNNEPLINSFYKQRLGLENLFRILVDLPPCTHVNLGGRIKGTMGLAPL